MNDAIIDAIIQETVIMVLSEIREHLGIKDNGGKRHVGTYQKQDIVQVLNLVESEWVN